MKICFTRASMMLAAMLLLTAPAMAQYMVKGSVKDALGEPLIGVSILVKGTTTGTVPILTAITNSTFPTAVSK